MLTFLQFLKEQKSTLKTSSNSDNTQRIIYSEDVDGISNNKVDLPGGRSDNSNDVTDRNPQAPEVNTKEDPKQQEKENPDRQGLIRKVKNAHLVYKRKAPNGTYTELWIYNIEKGVKDELDVRNAILAGTDVNPKTGKTQSGKQTYILWTNNNVQMLQVSGLPN